MIFAQIVIFGIAYLFEGNFDIFSFEPITLLWVSMTPFGAALIILLICVRFLHKIPIKNFFSSKKFFSWKYLFISATIWFFLAVMSDIILSFFQKGNYQFAFNAKTFIPFLLSTLLLVPIQITAEESFFRGYLQPGFSRLKRIPRVGVIFKAILIGLLHGANTEVSIYGVLTTMPFYIGIGLLLGIITRKYLGLEESLGLHFANNMYASLIVTFSGSSIESPALFLIRNYQPVMSLILFFITGIIYYFLLKYIQW
jgi:membrane protease YdiL (CAAX protease family)